MAAELFESSHPAARLPPEVGWLRDLKQSSLHTGRFHDGKNIRTTSPKVRNMRPRTSEMTRGIKL